MAHLEYHNNLVVLTETFYNSHKTLVEKIGLSLKLEPQKIEELVQKFVGDPLKVKAMKDPNKPKRAKTSYMYFCAEKRDELKKNNPELKMVDLSKLLGKLWGDTNEKNRKKYVVLADKDKMRYSEDKEQYDEHAQY
tara:strand:+ start:63 stop:470 length:408 start_codon:yes stop_codon:yes gene_type:complete